MYFTEILMLKISCVYLLHPVSFPISRIENLNIGPPLDFVMFDFILFQYGLQIICLFLTPLPTLLCDFAQPELLNFLSTHRYFVSFFCVYIKVAHERIR